MGTVITPGPLYKVELRARKLITLQFTKSVIVAIQGVEAWGPVPGW